MPGGPLHTSPGALPAAAWCARAAARPWVLCVGRTPGEERRACPDTLTRFDGLRAVTKVGTKKVGRSKRPLAVMRPRSPSELVQILRDERAAGVYSVKLGRAHRITGSR